MIEVTCQDCAATLLVNEDIVTGGLVRGDYVKSSVAIKHAWGSTYEEKVFRVCPKCRSIATRAMTTKATEATIAAEVQRTMRRLQEDNPEMSRELLATWAVEIVYDPNREPNPDYRAYLLERADKDEASDEKAREILANLDGPDVAGAA